MRTVSFARFNVAFVPPVAAGFVASEEEKVKLSKLRLAFLDRYADAGLLLLRSGLGIMLAGHHGWPKLMGGPEAWRHTGHAVAYLGLHSGYVAWGLLAALTECVGGVCLVLGWATRPVALALAVGMCVASIESYYRYFPFVGWSLAAWPFELAIVFFGLFLLGPGKYSLDSGV
ncbi:MAG: DoxX family protein [Opitutaceae bacterium]